MGGVSLPGGGGKRGLDFEINLVPFIDLLSCLIAFLLITAVWTQLSKVDTNQSTSQGANRNPSEQPPKFALRLDPTGYTLKHKPEDPEIRVPKKNGEYDVTALRSRIQAYRAQYPASTLSIVAAVDLVAYKDVAIAMDTVVSGGLKDVSLAEAPTDTPILIPGGG
jgi:biopolymer transport protein TolR